MTNKDLILSQSPAALLHAPSVSEEGIALQNLAGLWLRNRSIRTREAYEPVIRRFLEFLQVNGKPFENLQASALIQYVDDEISLRRKSAASKAHFIAILKSFFKFSFRAGIVPRDYGAILKSPKVPSITHARILDEVQIGEVLSQSRKDPRLYLLTHLLYYAGLRASEVSELQWKNVKIQPTKAFLQIIGKGQKTRVILLHEKCVKILKSIRSKKAPKPDIFVISGKVTSISRIHIFRLIKELGKSMNIPKLSPHWFRHSHATHALENGCQIHLLQATLGHSSISTTGRYLHVRPTDSSSKFLD